MLSWKNLKISHNEETTLFYPDFTIQQGQHTLILGQSGTGKTSLLHALAGLLQPSEGQITLNDNELTALKQNDLDIVRANTIGIVFQEYHLLKTLSVEQNIFINYSLRNTKEKNTSLLTDLGIAHLQHKYPSELSGGEKQRVAIARALSSFPQIILADEPTSNLDAINAKKVINLLLSQAEKHNATLVVISHDDRIKSVFEHQLAL